MSASDNIKLLEQDQLRVNSIHSQLSKRSGNPGFRGPKSTKTAIPVKSGQTVGSGNYIVTVGLGTPKKQLSLVLDTGSALSWTQCEPCVRYCYAQKEPIFKPLESTSYANVSCASELCNALESTTGHHLISPYDLLTYMLLLLDFCHEQCLILTLSRRPQNC